MGDVQKILFKPRARGASADDDIKPQKFFGSQLSIQAEKWKDEKFLTEDDRIGSFLDYLHKY
mgnify:CR=1 FL=1|jgi:hypothetical protein